MTTKRERLEAAISGEVADRPPVALWRHFPQDDQSASELAASTVAFQKTYDFDFVKVTPASSFCLKDWGVEDKWEGAAEGTRTYSKRVIEAPGDWEDLRPLSPDSGALAQQIDALRRICSILGPGVPVIQTVFSPLAQAKNLAGGERLLVHLRRSPKRVARALKVITETTVDFIRAAAGTGIAGVFYAVQHASFRYFDRESYQKIAESHDRKILETGSAFWLNVLHMHGEELMFDLAREYPCQILNWHDRAAGPPLSEGARGFSGAVCGGMDRWKTMVLGGPEDVEQEALQALKSMAGKGVVLGTGCVVPILAPLANLRAARQVVESFV